MKFISLSNKSFIVYTYVFSTLIIIGSILFSITFDIPFSDLSRDPISVAEAKPYIGFVSNIGVLFWSFTVGICFFTVSVLPRTQNKLTVHYFLSLAGIISFLLLLDDFFLFHERVFPRLFHLDEKFLFGFYGLLVAFYLIRFKDLILNHQFVFLLLALILFSISVLVDTFMASEVTNRHYFEDIPKFLGVMSWFCFHVLVCKNILSKATSH